MRNDKCQECGNPIDAFSLFFHPNTYLHDPRRTGSQSINPIRTKGRLMDKLIWILILASCLFTSPGPDAFEWCLYGEELCSEGEAYAECMEWYDDESICEVME
jgi:hypothetical protein